MSARRTRAIALGLVAQLASACAGSQASLGSTEPAVFDPNDRIDYAVTECGAQVLLFFPVMTNDRVARGMELIRQRAGDRYVSSVRMRERWTYIVFGEILCTDIVAATFGHPKSAEPPLAR